MTTENINDMYAAAVKAKVERSNSLGTKATWSMSDHLNVAAQCMASEASLPSPDFRDVCQQTYNHSAFAQKLAKAFAGSGHFQRDGKPRDSDDYMARLARELSS